MYDGTRTDGAGIGRHSLVGRRRERRNAVSVMASERPGGPLLAALSAEHSEWRPLLALIDEVLREWNARVGASEDRDERDAEGAFMNRAP